MPRSWLYFNAHSTGQLVEGSLLERQFEHPGGYLLLITESTPFEEGLHIYFLSRELKVLDELELGLPYAPGILKHVAVTDEDTVEFAFFGDERWAVTVLKKPAARWFESVTGPARRPWRRRFSKQYLTLKSLKPVIEP